MNLRAPVLLVLLAVSAHADDAFRAGLIALQRGDLEAARTNLEAAVRATPEDARIQVALAQTYWKLHQTSEAEDAAGKAAAFGSGNAVVQQSLAVYYEETGQTLKAARAASLYSAKQPGNDAASQRAAELYFDAARKPLDAQKFTEAVTILEEGVARQPNSAQLELALGVAYYGLRRFDAAAEAFLRTIAISPDREQSYLFLGKFLDQIPGRLPELTQRFAEYQAAHPTSAAGYLLHARALDAQSLDPATALQLLDRSIAIDASDPAAHFERGIVLERLQRFSDAAAAFERSIELNPKDPATHYRLARVYDRLGKHDAAQAERDRHATLLKAQESAR
jgi:tetratricopeptide (TPR) repeat protein